MSSSLKIYLGTNTKMYKNISQTVEFLKKLESLTKDISRDEMELFVIPSYTALSTARTSVSEKQILLGAQNMCWEEEGQFTGEISPRMLEEIGIQMVMIGHSERRHIFKESDPEENRKVLAALKHGFIPLLCVGETDEEKEYGYAEEVLRKQLKVGLSGITKEQAENVMIAYEPVWAIGVHGKPASKEYAEEIHALIHQTLSELFGNKSGGKIPVLYGGSVNPENAEGLISMPHIDGLFIGRSAWDADRFNAMIRQVLPLFRKKQQSLGGKK
jgi:triosephosphate isomerase